MRRFRRELVLTEEALHKIWFEFDPALELDTLMLHFCGEILLNHGYCRAAEWHTEPVIREIYRTISRDEACHAGAYLKYMHRALYDRGEQTGAQPGALSFSTSRVLTALAGLSRRCARPICT